MRVHWLQHVPFEGLGSIAPWLSDRGAHVTLTRLYEEPRFPALEEIDWLIAMGGPMSVHDESSYAWLAGEKQLIREAIAAGKVVLGICLGAQLIASAYGARVHPAEAREIGFFPVEPTPEAAESSFAPIFREPFPAFHWHGETFDLPPAAVPLARSAACAHQAFALGERVLAFQFHLETTPESARELIDHCAADMEPGPWVQSPQEMLAEGKRFGRLNAVMGSVLDHLAGTWA